jgi:hypothetical protein
MAEEDLPVEYDMSFSTNTRINYLLWKCNESMEKEDPLDWLKSCKNLLKECSTEMKDEEMTIHRQRIRDVEESIKKVQEYNRSYSSNGARKGMPYQPPRDAFDKLYEWELILRQKLDKMGLLFKKQEDYKGL